MAPAHLDYQSLTGVQLRQQFEAAGVRVTNTGNVPRLDPDDPHQALAARSELGAPDIPGEAP